MVYWSGFGKEIPSEFGLYCAKTVGSEDRDSLMRKGKTLENKNHKKGTIKFASAPLPVPQAAADGVVHDDLCCLRRFQRGNLKIVPT